MTDQRPTIVPPPELVQQWIAEIWHEGTPVQVAQSDLHIATRAAQWGYELRGEVNEAKLQKARDQELKECCEWLKRKGWEYIPDALRAARRPKPPSLKEQALMALEDGDTGPGASLTSTEVSIIRRALEALPDD